jgi:hypothetical protein
MVGLIGNRMPFVGSLVLVVKQRGDEDGISLLRNAHDASNFLISV